MLKGLKEALKDCWRLPQNLSRIENGTKKPNSGAGKSRMLLDDADDGPRPVSERDDRQ